MIPAAVLRKLVGNRTNAGTFCRGVNGGEWILGHYSFDLPLREQAAQYKELAVEAEAMARGMPLPRLKDAWLKIARDWRELAGEIDRSIEPPNDAIDEAPMAHRSCGG